LTTPLFSTPEPSAVPLHFLIMPANLLFSPDALPLVLASVLDSSLDFFKKGGIFMVPLALCSLAAVTLVILRALALRRDQVLPPGILSGIEQLPPGGDPENLGRLAGGDPSALGRLTRVGLTHLRWPKAENVEAVQVAARREILRLESGLGLLELIVGVSPLLGLLGAVSGLIRVFSNYSATKGQASDPAVIALGISEALHTTLFGIAIAVGALVAYTYFHKKVELYAVEMESFLADLLTKCYDVRSSRRAALESAGNAASSNRGIELEEDYPAAAASAPALTPAPVMRRRPRTESV